MSFWSTPLPHVEDPAALWYGMPTTTSYLEMSLTYSTHGFGVREGELARAMSRLPESLLIYGIEGKQVALGSALSLEVTRAVGSVVQQLLELARLYQSGAGNDAWFLVNP